MQLRPALGVPEMNLPSPRARDRAELSGPHASRSLSLGGLCCLKSPPRRGAACSVSRGWILRPAPTGKDVLSLMIRTGPLDLISRCHS